MFRIFFPANRLQNNRKVKEKLQNFSGSFIFLIFRRKVRKSGRRNKKVVKIEQENPIFKFSIYDCSKKETEFEFK